MAWNAKAFTAFRILFHARYYYPVFTLIFLDFGITLSQFALLNVIWALTIVIAEVPSGALADQWGRKKVMLIGSALMVVEMSVLLLAPIGGGDLLFWLFLINRIASGLAEAMVSGADEALAYDSLKACDKEKSWPEVLARTQKFSSAAMALVMITGALLYQPAWLGGGGTWFNGLKIPLLLTFIHAVAVTILVSRMQEPPTETEMGEVTVKGSFRQVLHTAQWLKDQRFLLLVILGALVVDASARQYIILNSEVFRLIGYPEWSLGFLSAGFAFFGILFAHLGLKMVQKFSPVRNFLITASLVMIGLIGASFLIPWWGILFVPMITSAFSLVPYLSSQYINRDAPSRHRATLLSFRGLANNLGLGLFSMFYGVIILVMKSNETAPGISEETYLGKSLPSLPIMMLAGILFVVCLMFRWRGKPSRQPSG